MGGRQGGNERREEERGNSSLTTSKKVLDKVERVFSLRSHFIKNQL